MIFNKFILIFKKNNFSPNLFLFFILFSRKTAIVINENIILACKKMQRDAQRQVYEFLAPKLYASCKRYLKQEEEIEEALADAFYIIFTKLDQLKEIGAFEAWRF